MESEEALRCCSSTSDFGGEPIFLLFQDRGIGVINVCPQMR